MNRIAVAMMGARRNYAVPQLLHEEQLLAHFFTDIYAARGWPQLLARVPGARKSQEIKRLLGRVPPGLPESSITAMNNFGLAYYLRLKKSATQADALAVMLWAGKEFCRLVLNKGGNNSTGFYTFNGAGLELLQHARQRGLPAVMEQTIAPMEFERELMRRECEKHPGWEFSAPGSGAVNQFIEREKSEWDEADVIICGSDFVKDSVAACGGPVSSCRVVPYGVRIPDIPARRKIPHRGPLRVLTVGAVGLRKGSPYVLAAATSMRGRAVFRMVGPLSASDDVKATLSAHLELVGSVPRAEIAGHLEWADVFLLPSLCEGSAVATYEALAAGLPVICTPNTGSLVRDGLDGFIVPPGDTEAIVEKLTILVENRESVQTMADEAIKGSSQLGLDRYKRRLVSVVSDYLGK